MNEEQPKPVTKALNTVKQTGSKLFQSYGLNLLFFLFLIGYITFSFIYGYSIQNNNTQQQFTYISSIIVTFLIFGYIYFRTRNFGVIISLVVFVIVYVIGFIYADTNNYGVTSANTQQWISTGLTIGLIVSVLITWFYAQYRFGDVPKNMMKGARDASWKQRFLLSLPWLKHSLIFAAIIGGFITILLYALYFAQGNPFASTAIELLVMLSVGAGAVYLGSRSIRSIKNNDIVKNIKKILLILFSLFGINFLSYEINNRLGVFISILSGLLITISSITSYSGMAKWETWLNLFYNSITYIPCLVFDGLFELYRQMRITPRVVYLVLLLEALLIGGYFALPKLTSYITNHDSVVLIDKPVYINTETPTMSHRELTEKISQTEHSQLMKEFEHLAEEGLKKAHAKVTNDMKLKHNYNFAISSYVFIDAQGANTNNAATRYATVWKYGNKPIIEYNAKENILRIRTQTNKDGKMITKTIYETSDTFYIKNGEKVDLSKEAVETSLNGRPSQKFPLQKWNNIIVNFKGGQIDIWINGELVATETGVVPYETHDTVVVGENDGIDGGVKDVRYYPRTLTTNEIWRINRGI